MKKIAVVSLFLALVGIAAGCKLDLRQMPGGGNNDTTEQPAE